jgi:5'-3' exoribonuclease 1
LLLDEESTNDEEFISPAEDGRQHLNVIQAPWSKVMKKHFREHRRDYYKTKMDYENISIDELREQAIGYVRAIQWVLHYYYHGCASWSWFYPHHYAPYCSDVAKYAHEFVGDFELSTPFLPFQQLLAVLPAASRNCLPDAYQVCLF